MGVKYRTYNYLICYLAIASSGSRGSHPNPAAIACILIIYFAF